MYKEKYVETNVKDILSSEKMDVLIEESLEARSESKRSYYDDCEEYDYDDEYEEYGGQEEIIDSGPVDITEDTLNQIVRDLCLIKLSWPEVQLKDPYLSQLPETYKTTSDKEKLLFWYAENFRKQFHTNFPDRKPLLLVCENECGIQKFVSTSIRPSTLPYPELYTWQGCANFVSDHLEYVPPKRPLSMPITLCSPTWLMNVQRGNCFEYATLLVSLLLGQGYNAFVVSGYASREQVRCDMSMRKCPYLPEVDDREETAVPWGTSRYKLKSPADFRSRLLLAIDAKKEKRLADELEARQEERKKMVIEQERPPPDKYWGFRIHAWVVILPQVGGAREEEIQTPFFIEPTSGMSYSRQDHATNLLYHGIESVWNDCNYWVNMQTCSEACAKIDWDLANTELWEHLLPGEPWTMRGIDDDDTMDKDLRVQQDKHLDMPFSYVDNIDIHSLDFERRYPNGTKTVYFKKTKVEFYAPYVQMDGLVRKITSYEDYDYQYPVHVEEKYLNRADNLYETRKFLDVSIVIDYYKRGRNDACKEHQYSTTGNDGIDEERILDFYDVVRLDGLSSVEMGPHYLTQHYIGRKDFLYYRHIEYVAEKERVPHQDIHYRTVSKITEMYSRNEKVPAGKDIAVRIFAIGDKEIRLKYHYETNKSTRATKTFIDPPPADRGERPLFNPDLIQGYNPDPTSHPEKQVDLYYEQEKQLEQETRALLNVKEYEEEISNFLKVRGAEYLMPKLTVSLFDRNRNEEAKAGIFAKEESLRAQSQREIERKVDYLAPYLGRLGNPIQLTKSQAFHVQKDCLNDLKQMLTNRANNISQMFESSSKELTRLQNWFTETEGKTKEEQEKMLNQINEMNFHLHTLDVRLQRHCELAPENYRYMVKILREDKRLAILYE